MRPAANEIDAIESAVDRAFGDILAELTDGNSHPMSERAADAVTTLRTFTGMSIRIIRKTNPSKVRDAALAEEIKARIEGRPLLEQ